MKSVRPTRRSGEPSPPHLLRSRFVSDGKQALRYAGPCCECGWEADGPDHEAALAVHVREAGIDVEAQRRDTSERMTAVYNMLWSRVLGPQYGLVVPHLTIEELRALTTVGFDGTKTEEGQRAFAVVQSAIERLISDRLSGRREPIALTSHPLETVCPAFAEAVRGDMFGLAPCLQNLADSERLALLQTIAEHTPAISRPGTVSDLANKLLDLVWTPDPSYPLFSLSSDIRFQYEHIVGLGPLLSEQEKADRRAENQRQMKDAKREQRRREASGEAERERQEEAALISKLEACVRRRDIGTAKRILRPMNTNDRWVLIMTLRIRFSDADAATFDAAVYEAAAWAFEATKPDPGIADLILGAFLTALPDRREAER